MRKIHATYRRITQGVFLRFFLLILVLSALFVNLAVKVKSVPYELDEIMYFNDTEVLDAFIRFDFVSPVWDEPAAFIQPPVSKYIYGAYLHLRHNDVRQVRDEILQNNNRYFLDQIDVETIPGSPLEPYLISMRQVALFFAFITLILFGYIIYTIVPDIRVTILLLLVIAQSKLFYTTLLVAKPDPIYLAFLLSGIILFERGIARKSMPALMASAMLGGISTSTILTGALFFMLIPPLLIVHGLFDHTAKLRFSLGACILMLYAGMWTWYIVNPSLYRNPVANTVKNISIRQEVLYYQRKIPLNQPAKIVSWHDMGASLSCVFIRHKESACENGAISPWPIINIGLLLLGMYHILRRVLVDSDQKAATVLTSALLITGVVCGFLPFNWARYYLPVFFIYSLINAYGIWYLLRRIPGYRPLRAI